MTAEYNTDLFAAATVGRLLGHLCLPLGLPVRWDHPWEVLGWNQGPFVLRKKKVSPPGVRFQCLPKHSVLFHHFRDGFQSPINPALVASGLANCLLIVGIDQPGAERG